MSFEVLQFGSQVAPAVPVSSQNFAPALVPPRTVDDVLQALERNEAEYLKSRKFQALRTTCSRLVDYFEKTLDEITLEEVQESRSKFRPFLEHRRYVEGTVHKYMDCVRLLLECAKAFGWNPEQSVPEAWRGIFALAKELGITELVRYLAGIRSAPHDVTIEDTDRWVELVTIEGRCFSHSANKKTRLWRLLRESGCTEIVPKCLLREERYGIAVKRFPRDMRSEVMALSKWKQAPFAMDRPKNGRVRSSTAGKLEAFISRLFGFVVNVRRNTEINSLAQLVQKQILGDYVAWCINERAVKGEPLAGNLKSLMRRCVTTHPTNL